MTLIMERLVLDHAVGQGCKNTRADVLRLQFALNSMASSWGGPKAPLPFDGRCDTRLITAIQCFQVHCFSNAKKASGKIEPGDRTHGKINQVLGGAVDVVAVTSHGGSAIEIGAKAFGTEIRFDGLIDLVSQVTKALAHKPVDSSFGWKLKKLGNLTVSSHGAPGYMRLTGAKVSDTTVGNNLVLAQLWFDDMVNFQPDELLGEQTEQLAFLKGQFVRGGLLTLSACRVAAPLREVDKKTKKVKFDIDGRNFLKGISKAIGNVAVQGGSLRQNDVDFGMEGPCWRCDSHACVQITPQSTSFFGPDFSVADEFGHHYLEDVATEEAALAAVEHAPPLHPDKQRLLKKLFNRKRMP
jgi:hypothetical protein